MKKFFRKDLKLDQKWWHRLVCVVWFLSLLVILFYCGLYIHDWYYGVDYAPSKVYVWPLQDRTNNEIKDLHDLLNPWEYVDFTPDSYSSRYDLSSLLDMPYWISWCSKWWYAGKISKLNDKLGNQIVKEGDANSKYKVYREIADSIEGDCIFLVDWVFHYDWGSLYIYAVDRPNKFKVTMWWLLPRLWESIILILVYVWLSLLIYYKGVLYIVYWKSK